MARMSKEERERHHKQDLIRVERIETLMEEQGKRPVDLAVFLKQSRQSSYLSVVKNNQTVISDARLSKIAKWLGTSIEYLNGETDDAYSNVSVSVDSLSVEEKYIVDTFRMCSSYEEHRSLLDLCDQLRAKNGLGSVTTA